MIVADQPRPWAEWRADLEASGLVRVQSARARSERAATVSPLVSLELLDEYELSVDWDAGVEMYVARCRQVPFVWWPHPDSRESAVLSLAMYLASLVVGLNSDLCLVPGLSAKSEAAEQRWHLNESDARESFLGTLNRKNEGQSG